MVAPNAMHGWVFYDDQHDVACADQTVCSMVQGPGLPPAGGGSAELATSTAGDGKALLLPDYGGTRFDQITDLHYSTYRQTADAGNNLAIALQFNVDYDLTDTAHNYQGRLVFEPYQGGPGTVVQGAWQSWDAKAGKWWGTKSSVWRGGALVANACVQSSPCTWAALVTAFPDLGVHATLGAVVLKAGSGWAGFRGNVDRLSIGVAGVTTTFNFELVASVVPALSPDTTPTALFDSLGNVSSAPNRRFAWVRSMVAIGFQSSASQADRQAAVWTSPDLMDA